MLELVIDQPRKRRPFPPVPLRLLLTSEPAQPDQVLPAGPQLQQLEFESLMFDAAQHTAPQVVHGAPVENSQGHLIAEANKRQTVFSLCFRHTLSRWATTVFRADIPTVFAFSAQYVRVLRVEIHPLSVPR